MTAIEITVRPSQKERDVNTMTRHLNVVVSSITDYRPPVTTLVIGRRHRSEHLSVREAQAEYVRLRDESGEGCSTFPHGKIWEVFGPRIRISYNGRLWLNDKPIYE